MNHNVCSSLSASKSGNLEEDWYEKEEKNSTTPDLPVSGGPSTNIKCNLGAIPCKDNTKCVLYNHVCDGEVDCSDGSDEGDCALACGTGIKVDLCGVDPYTWVKNHLTAL